MRCIARTGATAAEPPLLLNGRSSVRSCAGNRWATARLRLRCVPEAYGTFVATAMQQPATSDRSSTRSGGQTHAPQAFAPISNRRSATCSPWHSVVHMGRRIGCTRAMMSMAGGLTGNSPRAGLRMGCSAPQDAATAAFCFESLGVEKMCPVAATPPELACAERKQAVLCTLLRGTLALYFALWFQSGSRCSSTRWFQCRGLLFACHVQDP